MKYFKYPELLKQRINKFNSELRYNCKYFTGEEIKNGDIYFTVFLECKNDMYKVIFVNEENYKLLNFTGKFIDVYPVVN